MGTTKLDTKRNLASKSELRKTLADRVVEQLRREIISGHLQPGTMVAEIPTAQRLEVSRVPVREAIMALEHDGLLVIEENGRCRVRTLTPIDFDEIYDVRLMLESESFRLAAQHHTESDLQLAQANIQQMERARSLNRVSQLDIEFHDQIVAMSRQTRLNHLWKVMRGQIQLFTATLQRELSTFPQSSLAVWRDGEGQTPFQIGNVREISVEAHRKCLQGIASRDPELAKQCAIDHLKPWSDWLKSTRSKGQMT